MNTIHSKSFGRLPESEVAKFEEWPRWKTAVGAAAVAAGLILAAVLIAVAS